MEKENKFPLGINLKVINDGDKDCRHIFYASLRSREKKCMNCQLVVKEI